MTKYAVYIRDSLGNLTGQIDEFDSLKLVRRYNEFGTWELTSNTDLLLSLTKTSGIQVDRNGIPFFSGFVRSYKSDGKKKLTVYGLEDTAILNNRLVYPVVTGAPFSTDYDTRIGLAEKIIKEYVNYNAGPLAMTQRQITGLTIETDYSRGSTITGKGRFDNLLEFVKALAIQGGVGFKITALQFKVTVPRDLTTSIVLSQDMGTLGDSSYTIDRPSANYYIVGGSSSGSARAFAETQDSDSINSWGRIERFLDFANTATVSELIAAGQVELDKNAEKVNVTANALTQITGMKPIDDFDIGDIITVKVDGQTVQKSIQEASITVDKSGEAVNIVVGTTGQKSDDLGLLRLFQDIQNISSKVSMMERR